MNEALEVTRDQVRALAKLARRKRDQAAAVDGFDISLSAYRTFEAGTTWPRAAGLRAIESMHGWKPGIIDEVESRRIEPSLLTLEHMTGKRPLIETPKELSAYTMTELLQEIARRNAESERIAEETKRMYGLAASRDLGNPSIGMESLPDE